MADANTAGVMAPLSARPDPLLCMKHIGVSTKGSCVVALDLKRPSSDSIGGRSSMCYQRKRANRGASRPA